MPSEVKRGFIRITSNYGRLFISVALGLYMVRLLLKAVGEDGWGVVALFGSTIGIADMVQSIIRRSMIRELGAAYHSDEPQEFERAYNSAIAVSLVVAVIAAGVYTVLFLLIPVFNLQDMEAGGRGMVIAGGIQAVIMIACVPTFNMYMVSERMFAFNAWSLLIQRGAGFIGALSVATWADAGDPSGNLIRFATIDVTVATLATVVASLLLAARDRRFFPRLGYVTKDSIRSICTISGWNAVIVTAMNLHLRTNAIIMNLAFGLFGSRIFGYTMQLTGYARRIAVGMTDGLDAVSARVSSGDQADPLRRLLHYSTRMHAVVTFPAAVLLWILSGPIIDVWIGDLLSKEGAKDSRGPTIALIQIVVIGNAVRSISDAWIRILYGAGYIKQYAPIILIGGIANPLLCLIFIWLAPNDAWGRAGIAWSFTLVMIVVHGFYVAQITARAVNVRFINILRPMSRPALVTIACTPIFIAADQLIHAWSFPLLVVVCAAFGIPYAILTWMFTLYRDERERFASIARQRFGGRRMRESDLAQAQPPDSEPEDRLP